MSCSAMKLGASLQGITSYLICARHSSKVWALFHCDSSSAFSSGKIALWSLSTAVKYHKVTQLLYYLLLVTFNRSRVPQSHTAAVLLCARYRTIIDAQLSQNAGIASALSCTYCNTPGPGEKHQFLKTQHKPHMHGCQGKLACGAEDSYSCVTVCLQVSLSVCQLFIQEYVGEYSREIGQPGV